jgi:predicted nucleotidyltransferase
MGKKVFDIPSEKIADYCRRWKITELALFGSALRDDFNPESDVDVLVTFDRDARGIESSQNYLRRKEILSSAKVIHVSR